MILKSLSKIKLLKSMVLIIPFFLITFFIISPNVYAASFKYSEFNFEEFAKENLGYWSSFCAEEEKQGDQEKCEEKILKSQEKFYTRLYKLLAKYESKGLKIDDNIIISTVFFELNPQTFADNNQNYANDNFDEDSFGYREDDDDLNNYDIDAKAISKEMVDYFEEERDTLKLLLKAMIGYKNYCYGLYTTATVQNEDGTSYQVCTGGTLRTIENKSYCATLIEQKPSGFWDDIMRTSRVQRFFGIKSDKEKECELSGENGDYSNGILFYTENSKTVNEDLFWEFLEKGQYFDRKAHLQYRFKTILEKTQKTKMSDLTEEEYEEYDAEIKDARMGIILDIKSILTNYKNSKPNDESDFETGSSTSYWWPIGSNETETVNGKLFASGTPAAINISSKFGPRIHPIRKTQSFHSGIDISGISEAGGGYIIAAQSGVVTKVVTGCESYGDTSCGGGYGNYVIISHSDGNYTVYAHMHQNSITVTENESVKQGQVIGKIGSSGSSTGTHLHFEVRTGADSSYAVDPLDYVDPDNPRKTSSSGELVEFISSFEGTGPTSGDNYIVYCNRGDVPTVGHGIALTYNVALLKQFGINLVGSSPYNNYCGQAMPKDVIDQVYAARLEQDKSNVQSSLASSGISNLTDYQLDALTSLHYNCGNINGFVPAYQTYGATQSLCTNWWNNKAITSGGRTLQGLIKRRQHECNLFVTGEYIGND